MNLLHPLMLLVLMGLTIFLIRRIRVQFLLHLRRLEEMSKFVTADFPTQHVAEQLVEDAELTDVTVESSAKFKSNHYNSDIGAIRLTDETGTSMRLNSYFIAAHEVGHAVLDRLNRLLKFVVDLAAHLMALKLVSWIALAAVLLIWLELPLIVHYIALPVVAILLVATLIIQLIEHLASVVGFRLLRERLELPEHLQQHIRRNYRTAGLTHFCDVMLHAALFLILLAGAGWLPELVAFSMPLACLLFFVSLYRYRTTMGNRLHTSCRLPLPF